MLMPGNNSFIFVLWKYFKATFLLKACCCCFISRYSCVFRIWPLLGHLWNLSTWHNTCLKAGSWSVCGLKKWSSLALLVQPLQTLKIFPRFLHPCRLQLALVSSEVLCACSLHSLQPTGSSLTMRFKLRQHVGQIRQFGLHTALNCSQSERL